MKVVKKLDLGKDFDKNISLALTALLTTQEKDSERAARISQEHVTEVRRIAHQAYKLGQENPNV